MTRETYVRHLQAVLGLVVPIITQPSGEIAALESPEEARSHLSAWFMPAGKYEHSDIGLVCNIGSPFQVIVGPRIERKVTASGLVPSHPIPSFAYGERFVQFFSAAEAYRRPLRVSNDHETLRGIIPLPASPEEWLRFLPTTIAELPSAMVMPQSTKYV